jgi:hypothetical protein
MAKFVFIYTGGGPMSDDAAVREAAMAAWMGWFGGLGAAVTDMGNPFGGSTTVGAAGTGSGATGYSIVEATDLTAAAEMAKGCPIIAHGGAVEVHEALGM